VQHEISPNGQRTNFRDVNHALATWNDGVSLVEDGNYVAAIAVYRRLAEKNYQGAAEVLARIYESGGPGVPIDLNESRAWYEVAIREEGGAEATLGLVRILLRSTLHEDCVRGIKLLEQAVSDGDMHSVMTYATMCEVGFIVQQDLNRAKNLFEQASSAGYIYALGRLDRIALKEKQYIRFFMLRIKIALAVFQISRLKSQNYLLWQVDLGLGS
jgi:TPR repeat protein